MEEWKSNNPVREHTAKLMANNENANQRNNISAKNHAETLQQYAPFLNSMVSGGGQKMAHGIHPGLYQTFAKIILERCPFRCSQ